MLLLWNYSWNEVIFMVYVNISIHVKHSVIHVAVWAALWLCWRWKLRNGKRGWVGCGAKHSLHENHWQTVSGLCLCSILTKYTTCSALTLSHFPHWAKRVKNRGKATQPERGRPCCCLLDEVGGDAVMKCYSRSWKNQLFFNWKTNIWMSPLWEPLEISHLI